MNKYQLYEAAKLHLLARNLTCEEYEKQIKILADRLGV